MNNHFRNVLHVGYSTVILFFLILSISGYAIECRIGDQSLIIPSVEGFTAASAISDEIADNFSKFTPPSNRYIETFVPLQDAGKLLVGETVELNQYLRVSTLVETEQTIFSKSQFKTMRTMLRDTYENKLDALNKKIEDLLADIEANIKITGNIPLGIDSETSNSITVSLLLKSTQKTEQGEKDYVQAGTMTTLLIKGKILYLYVYRAYKDETDIAWTRTTANKWVEKILSANETTYPLSLGGIVPSGTLIDSKTKKLLAAETSEYSTKGHTKSQGLEISIRYPTVWKAEEGTRPHIVHKFTGIDSDNISISRK